MKLYTCINLVHWCKHVCPKLLLKKKQKRPEPDKKVFQTEMISPGLVLVSIMAKPVQRQKKKTGEVWDHVRGHEVDVGRHIKIAYIKHKGKVLTSQNE